MSTLQETAAQPAEPVRAALLSDQEVDGILSSSTSTHDVARAIEAAALQQVSDVVVRLVEALTTAQNGLEWYRDRHPEDTDGSDDEADAEFDQAIAAARTALASQGADSAATAAEPARAAITDARRAFENWWCADSTRRRFVPSTEAWKAWCAALASLPTPKPAQRRGVPGGTIDWDDAPEPAQEPVAWAPTTAIMRTRGLGITNPLLTIRWGERKPEDTTEHDYTTPLYAQPVPAVERKALTDEHTPDRTEE